MEEVLAKYFSGEATEEEISLVEKWRSEEDTNAKEFIEAKTIWLNSSEPTAPDNQVLESIFASAKVNRQVHLWSSNWFKYAAAAVLVVAISLLYLLGGTAELGYETKSLADGSEVSLHGDSKLEVLNINRSIREVKVTGKAYFNIERDENRPFVIHTGNAKIEVLGTSFVVDTYNNKTEVSVESGLVELTKSSRQVSVRLSKGEVGLVLESNEGIIKKNNHDANYLSWKTKILTFKESTMDEVKTVLEDTYGIQVNFENPEFRNCKLTARFNKKKAKDAIEIIARTFNMEVEFSNGIATFKGKGC